MGYIIIDSIYLEMDESLKTKYMFIGLGLVINYLGLVICFIV